MEFSKHSFYDFGDLSAFLDELIAELDVEISSLEPDASARRRLSLVRFYREVYVRSKEIFSTLSPVPGAKGWHHAYPNGLISHTLEQLVMFQALRALPMFVRVNPHHVFIGCLYSDIGKTYELTTPEVEITPYRALVGHISLSALIFNRLVDAVIKDLGLRLPVQERFYLLHCILAHHSELERGSPVVPATKEAFLVAQLDQLSANGIMYDNIKEAKSTKPRTVIPPNIMLPPELAVSLTDVQV
jgi:23S rRNA maturation-related 3'-5' exoribonuclease YhaM